jgi:N-acetylmuramoyl-L-alanine amidase
MVYMHIYYTKKAVAAVTVILCSFILMTSVVIFASAYGNNLLFENTSNGNDKTVIINPGHGAPDGGAVGVDGVIKKDINLAISLKLKNLFQVAGYTVIMTREDDNVIYDDGSKTIRKKKVSDLHNRLEIVDSHPDAVFISIHQNIYKSSKDSGSVVFYSPNNERSKELAQFIQTGVTNMLQPQNT